MARSAYQALIFHRTFAAISSINRIKQDEDCASLGLKTDKGNGVRHTVASGGCVRHTGASSPRAECQGRFSILSTRTHGVTWGLGIIRYADLKEGRDLELLSPIFVDGEIQHADVIFDHHLVRYQQSFSLSLNTGLSLQHIPCERYSTVCSYRTEVGLDDR